MGFTTALGHTPIYTISKGGEDITDRLADRVISIRVEDRDGGGEADVCDIVIDDRDWSIALPSLGEGSATLSIAMGYAETGLYQMGTFEVDDIEIQWPPKQLVLHGNSLGMITDAKAPIITSFDGQTLGNIVSALAGSAGLSAAVDATLAAIPVPYLQQANSSMHQLQQLERTYNGMAKISDGKLSFTVRGSGNNASGQSIGNCTLTSDDFGPGGNSIKLTNDSAYSSVKAAYFDTPTQTNKFVTSAIPGSQNSSVPYNIRPVYPSQTEAQSMADSTMAQLNRKCKTGTLILAKGAPQIRAGQNINIAGCRDGIDGTYIVSRAVHTLSKGGGLSTVLDVYDEGGGADLPAESTDGTLDSSGISTTVPLGQGGIGHQ